MDVLIRDLPDDVHAELTRRAAAADQSLRAYLSEVLMEHVSVPTMRQWLDAVKTVGPIDDASVTGADAIAAARREDDARSPV